MIYFIRNHLLPLFRLLFLLGFLPVKIKNFRVDRQSIIFFCIWVVSLLFFRVRIINFLDFIFFEITGKSLLTRNLFIQIAVLSGSFLLIFFLPIFLQKLFFRRIDLTKNSAARVSILIPLIVIFVCFSILAWNVRLKRDDYWEIFDAQTFGQFMFIGSSYLNLMTRYTSLFLKSFYALFPPVLYIDSCLILCFVMIFYGLSLINKLFLENFSKIQDIPTLNLISFVMGGNETVALLLMSPKIWEIYLWGSGAFVYAFGIGLTILSINCILRIILGKSKSSGFFIFTSILCILSCGCSELTTISFCIFSFALLIGFRLFYHHPSGWNKTMIFFWILSWIAALFSFAAPGGKARADSFVQISTVNSFFILIISRISDAFQTGLDVITGFFLYRLDLLVFFLLVSFLLGLLVEIRKEKIKQLLFIIFVLLFASFVCILPNALLHYVPTRVVGIPWSWIYLSSCLLTFTAGSLLVKKPSKEYLYVSLIIGTIIPMCIFGSFFSNSIDMVKRIRLEWEYRDQILQTIDKQPTLIETCQIPVLGTDMMDVLENPQDEFNKIIAEYYGINKITATDSCRGWIENGQPQNLQ